MKRPLLLTLLFLFAIGLFLTACARRELKEASEEIVPHHTVTFYDGDLVVGLEQVEDGRTLTDVPASEGLWRDADGTFADPAAVPVMGDMSFFVWRQPALNENARVFMSAYGEQFKPDDSMSRAEAAELICALLADDTEAVGPNGVFTDVPQGASYYDAVSAVGQLGLMNGYPDGSFRPMEPITRAQFAAVLYRIAGVSAGSEAGRGFSDVPEDYWAYEALTCADERGWITGYDGGRFYPERPITRAEAAVMTIRMRGGGADAESVALVCGGSTPYVDVLPSNWAFCEIIEASYESRLLDYITGRAMGVRPGLVLIDDRLCYIEEDTLRLARFEAGFRTIGGRLYYVDTDGYFIHRFSEGLLETDGSMYYVTADDGPFLTDDNYGYLYFGPDGRYTTGDEELDGYVDNILSGILYDSSLTRDEKLYRAYCSIRDGGYYYRSMFNSGWGRGTVSWAPFCAKIMYSEKGGTCYYWASSFLFLARRLGYQAYPVCGGVGTANQLHAWVVIDWDDGEQYIFDVELEWAYRSGFYDVPHTTTNMYKQPLHATNVRYVFPDQTATYYSAYGVPAESDEDFLNIPEEAQVPPEMTATPEPTASPAPTETPVEPTSAPVEPTEAPAEPVPTEAPPVQTDAPVEPVPPEDPNVPAPDISDDGLTGDDQTDG